MILIIIAAIIFALLKAAFKDNNVVKLPGPAISGKARGKTVAFSGLFSSLYILIPKIISKAMKNITKEPAMAKE